MNTKEKIEKKIRRHRRVRAKIRGKAQRPRLTIHRAHRHIRVQLIDDEVGRTLAAAGDHEAGAGKKKTSGGSMASAQVVGELIAARALEKKIHRVVLDRGPYRYHGAVRAVAEAARKGGLSL